MINKGKLFKKLGVVVMTGFLMVGTMGLSTGKISPTTAYAAAADNVTVKTVKKAHGPIAMDLQSIFKAHPKTKALFEKAIAKGAQINPDRITNPAQTLEEYYDVLDWMEKPMPWNMLKDAQYSSIFVSIDQGLDYFYFFLDIPLPELEKRGYYYNCLEYVEEIQPWLVKYAKNWGNYLSTPDSWNNEYSKRVLKEKRFNLDKGWYEGSSNWHSFNDFFSRRLSSPSARPIANPNDNSVVITPADSVAQGVWDIDKNSYIVSKAGVNIKSSKFYSIPEIIGKGSSYTNAFANGKFTHAFLNVDDYHRYHFPVSGVIKEVRMIPAQDAVGGIVTWDPKTKRYMLDSIDPAWQAIETRGCVIVDTGKYGLVALLPIGMSQVSSVNFENSVKVGATVKKGDPLGYFLFGGSDFIMIFQQKAGFVFQVPETDSHDGTFEHLLMGNKYGTMKESTQALPAYTKKQAKSERPSQKVAMPKAA